MAPANAVFSMGTPDSSFSNGVTPLGAAVAVPKQEKKPSSSFFTGKKKKDNKKPRIRKEDISNPTNFQFVFFLLNYFLRSDIKRMLVGIKIVDFQITLTPNQWMKVSSNFIFFNSVVMVSEILYELLVRILTI